MSTPSTRRLAAVMIADVAGYSRLMEQDEAGTHTRLLDIRAQVTDPIVRRHGGRIVRTVGDGLLVEFASAMSALVAAIEIQRTMQERNRGLAAGERIDHRIGINLGDILVDTNDIAGNGVNVAARLEAIAPPGGIAVSGTVRNQVRQDLGVTFVDAGEQRVKNISQPIRVFKVELGAPSSLWTRLHPRRWTRWAAAAIGALALVASVHFGYQALAPRARPAQSLVVLPFAAISDNPGAAALAASLTSQLTSAVSRVADLTVIAPTVAARFTAPRADIKQIGRELDVRYALAGRIESAGDRTRVAAHLVDTDTGASLWSTELDAPPSADGSAPIALIGRLSDSLRSAVRGAELKRLSRQRRGQHRLRPGPARDGRSAAGHHRGPDARRARHVSSAHCNWSRSTCRRWSATPTRWPTRRTTSMPAPVARNCWPGPMPCHCRRSPWSPATPRPGARGPTCCCSALTLMPRPKRSSAA